jgi:hypothetical protein
MDMLQDDVTLVILIYIYIYVCVCVCVCVIVVVIIICIWTGVLTDPLTIYRIKRLT